VIPSIAPRLVAASILTMPGAQHVAPVAVAKLAADAVGLMLLVVVVTVGILLAVVATAARGLLAALAEMARLAAVMMSTVGPDGGRYRHDGGPLGSSLKSGARRYWTAAQPSARPRPAGRAAAQCSEP
jgi:hypothetical protein